MTNFSSNRPSRNEFTISFKDFFVKRDIKFAGYKVVLNWEQSPNDEIIGFSVYKAILKQPLLSRNFFINQTAMEKLAAIKSYRGLNTILFNKNFFSQNSKVTFFNSDTDRFDKKEGDPSEINFFLQKFVRLNKKTRSYSLSDSDVRFGETYAYVISTLNRSGLESIKSIPLYVNVEDIEHPSAPFFEVSQVTDGALLQIHAERNEDIVAFDVWRRREDEQDFERIGRSRSIKNDVVFSDKKLLPGKFYEYAVYSVDFFGNISWAGTKKKIFIDGRIQTGTTCAPRPEFMISVDGPSVIIAAKKNFPDAIGFKIERRDTWRFEKGFGLKTYKDVPWSPCILFQDDMAKFVDFSTKVGRRYQYRISTILKNNSIGAVFVAPVIQVFGAGQKFSTIKEEETKVRDLGKTKIKKFEFVSLNKKQRPLFVKFTWDITGQWNYIIIEANDLKLRVDDVHEKEAVFIDFKPETNYQMKFSVFDENGNMLDSQNAVFTT